MNNFHDKIIILPDEEERLVSLKKIGKKVVQIVFHEKPKLLIALDVPMHWAILYYFCLIHRLPVDKTYKSPSVGDMIIPPTTNDYKSVGMGLIIRSPYVEREYGLYGQSIHYDMGINTVHVQSINRTLTKTKFT